MDKIKKSKKNLFRALVFPLYVDDPLLYRDLNIGLYKDEICIKTDKLEEIDVKQNNKSLPIKNIVAINNRLYYFCPAIAMYKRDILNMKRGIFNFISKKTRLKILKDPLFKLNNKEIDGKGNEVLVTNVNYLALYGPATPQYSKAYKAVLENFFSKEEIKKGQASKIFPFRSQLISKDIFEKNEVTNPFEEI